MQAINPATEQLVRDYEPHDKSAVESRLRQAEETYRQWRLTDWSHRADLMQRAAQVLRADSAHWAELMTEEMGKPITGAESEVEKCAWVCEYYAEQAERFLAPREEPTDARRSFVRFDPLGPVLAVMPWNFPFWQVFRFAAPALMAGNVGVLKHASNVPGCALAIEEVFRHAGFPEGCFTTLLISGGEVAEVIAHDAIRAVTLTGSEKAGVSVAAAAGKHLKKTVLELGGSDPFIVLADADVDRAAEQAAIARTINSGQSCIAAKRFIVEQAVADKFQDTLAAEMNKLVIDDPVDRKTQIGPQARQDLMNELHDQVERTVQSGAKLLAGGSRLDRTGYFYPPTVLANVTPGMAAFDEETFGPVAAVTVARDADEAVALANRSPYGLGGSLWTADLDRAERLAAEIESGAVFINAFTKSDPRLPFGGVKRSGYGRELADFGIREFVNIKTVWVD